ncbi:sensor histidine kinase [Devosia faecipullorum]|uniref:sensor histidine kinase n=1 Tax=Devosia faecipullorum TaxID=2755039 RepID=UPI00187B785C|nr:cache domain-containing protein [Devosia faecipullorum]MBE7731719.1 sensor histidine kinase [Devosia faecipullorum]
MTYFISEAVNQARSRLEDRSRAAAQIVATNAGWLGEVAQQTLRRIDAALGPEMSGDPAALQAAIEGLPADIDIYIIDANARTMFSTVPGAAEIDVSDREYFTAVREGRLFYTSDMIVSRITGEAIFVFSKRVTRNGQFAGAIMVSFSDSVLQPFWVSLDLDPQSTVSLVRRDGALMARFPAPERPLDLSDHPLITEHLPASESGTYFSESSPVDGVARMVSYQTVPGTEMLAVASIATIGTSQTLRGVIIALLITVTPIVLALLGIGAWVLVLLRRDARRRAELEAAQDTNVLLFREIHHRVKNNLQSVQSLVRMQDIPASAKIDLQSRLSAMAAMHEHIYRHDRYEDIDAHDLVPVVAGEVVQAYGADVDLRYDVDHAAVDRDHTTPLSLLLSELITNTLKYAFADGRRGAISVTLRDLGNGRCSLVVADNGTGIGVLPDAPTSMGLRLIRGIVSQMGGTYRYVDQDGTRFEAELALASAGHAGLA